MLKITAEGLEFFYFTKIDPSPPSQIDGIDVFRVHRTDFDFVNQLVAKHNDFRLIISDHSYSDPPRRFLGLRWLYWSDDTALDALDRKIELSTFSDSDFALSFSTYLSKTICFECGWAKPTLVNEPDFYYGNSEVRVRKRATEPDWMACPNCGRPLRLHVLKIFDA